MKFKIVFEVPGQLRKEATWDTTTNPDLPDTICDLMDGKAAIFDKRERTTHALVDGHQIAAEEYKTAMAQVDPKASGDPSMPTPIERLGGAETKRRNALRQTRPKLYTRLTESQAKLVGDLLAQGWPLEDIATQYHFKPNAIYRIWLGHSFLLATGFTPYAERTGDKWSHVHFNRKQNGEKTAKGKAIAEKYKNIQIEQNQRRYNANLKK